MTSAQVMSELMLRSFAPFNKPLYMQHIQKDKYYTLSQEETQLVCTAVQHVIPSQVNNIHSRALSHIHNTKPVLAIKLRHHPSTEKLTKQFFFSVI